MSTFILSVIIFGFAGYIIYTRWIKKSVKDCDDSCHCPAKPTKNNLVEKKQ